MPYKIAGIDVHKRMLHVVVSDVQVDGEYDFTRRILGSLPEALRSLAAWLVEPQVHEVVVESTAQYWKPVWGTLERYWKPTREGTLTTSGTLHLAQALSNRGRRGRKKDFRDAERLVKRLVAHELVLSFVPDDCSRLRSSLTGRRWLRGSSQTCECGRKLKVTWPSHSHQEERAASCPAISSLWAHRLS